jgi:FdhD protein
VSGRGRTKQFLIRRSDARALADDVIVEEPMEIRLDGHVVATTMRTPGHDFELAVGFLHGEGMLGHGRVREIRYCATGPASESAFNVVDVDTAGIAPTPTARLGTVTAACGLCGNTSIEELAARLDPLAAGAPIDMGVVAGMADEVRAQQKLFGATGSVHAAAAFSVSTGAINVVREDIGRHNAVDKVVGRLVLDGTLPAGDGGLFVSGRASFEIVQKAWAAGFRLVAAVSGPSALAVETARRANVALVGFLRGDSWNLYSPAPL